MYYHLKGYQQTPRTVEKVQDLPIPTNAKRSTFLSGTQLPTINGDSFQNLPGLPNVYMSWLVQHQINLGKLEVKRKENWLQLINL